VESSTAHVLIDPADHTALGKALAIADSEGADGLHLIVDANETIAARRAGGFAADIHVWRLEGRSLVEARPAPMPDETVPDVPLEMLGELRAAELDVATEHGIVRGEVLGLEVARIAADPPTLNIGVGIYDQEAFAVINAGQATNVSLARVRDEVLSKRRPGADSHPFNRLVRERWLRALAVRDPSSVGVEELLPVAPLVERGGLKEVRPCAALGHDGAEPVLVVFSSGIDLDLIPTAAELAVHHQPQRIVLAVAERDRHPVTGRMAALLAWPMTFVAPANL
jgi:hypothetical protein